MQKSQKIVDKAITQLVGGAKFKLTQKNKKLIKQKYMRLFVKPRQDKIRQDDGQLLKEFNNYASGLGLDNSFKKASQNV